MHSLKLIIKLVVVAVTLAVTAFSSQLFADEGPTYVDKKGYAIKGYDPVAYFTESAAVKGDEAYSYEWNHGLWLFSSNANRELFEEDPEKYAPQYGGYCAYAVAKGKFAKVDPEKWTVLDGKLYLNYNKRINDRWTKKRDEYIAKGNQNWFGDLKDKAIKNISD